MFLNVQPLTSLDLSSWGTSNVVKMSDMLSNIPSLEKLTLRNKKQLLDGFCNISIRKKRLIRYMTQ